MKLGEWLGAVGKRIYSISEKPILTSTIVLVVLGIIVILLSLPYYQDNYRGYIGQILAEAHGMIFDIAVIGILILWLNKTGEKRSRIRNYKDEIDDFRLWESEEAAFRTVGNIKRLNRHNIAEINLVNCYLSKANLNYIDLNKSNLNSANLSHSSLLEANLDHTRMNQTDFSNSNLNQATFRNAYASGAIFDNCYLIKTNFENAFLIKTDFSNALLMDANFGGSYLTGASFENASLYKADFRGAKGLSLDQLAKAKTLYRAKFDQFLYDQIVINLPELIGDEILKEV